LLVLWLMMSLTMTGITIPPGLLVEEKEKRTIRALLVTPASYADVIAAKALVGLVYVMLGAWFILWLNQGFTGEVALTSVVILLTALFMVEIGLCLGALFNDLSTLQTWSFAVLLPFMLPGMLVPLSAAGVFSLGPVDLVLRLLPTYYTVTAIQPALNGTATLARLADDLAIIGLGIVVAFGLAVALLRRREC
jgi:ABC-2 type transport system permease protein